MGAKTNRREGLDINAAWGDSHDANHADNFYMGLVTAITDGETQAWTECADANYARQLVANSDANWDKANGGAPDANADGVADDATVRNINPIEWPAFATQQSIAGVVWFISGAGNDADYYHEFPSPVVVPAGVSARLAAGALTYQEDD